VRLWILAWSTFSGVLLGAFISALVAGLWAVASSGLSMGQGRTPFRIQSTYVIAALLIPPIVGGVLGFLEGRLKA
jgi:hypothetical protein